MADGCWGRAEGSSGAPRALSWQETAALATKFVSLLRSVAVRQTSRTPWVALAPCSFLEYTFHGTCLLEPKPGLLRGLLISCRERMRPETPKSSSPHSPLPAAVTERSMHLRALASPDAPTESRRAVLPKSGCRTERMQARGGEEMKSCPQLPTSTHTNTRATGTSARLT